MGKRALIFGVSGQDGGYLSELLLEEGYEVYGTSRDAQISTFSNLNQLGIKDKVHLLSANPIDFRSTLNAIVRAEPDEIYNLAGQSSVNISFDQPVDTFNSIGIANLNLLEVIRFLGGKTKYYNAGSSECFGNTLEPASEKTAFHPRSPYAVAKATAFWQVANYREAYGIFACSGILFNHESPLRPARFVTRKIVSAACRIAQGSNEKLSLGNIDIARDWGWAPEYVHGMWQIMQQDKPDDYIIATGKTHQLKEFISMVFATLNLDWQEYTKFEPELIRPTEIMVSRANPSKAYQELKWQAKYQLPDVIRMLIEHEMKTARKTTSIQV